jgi:predicted dinucleotide-utilizing enzyme
MTQSLAHSLYIATLGCGLTVEVAGCGQSGKVVLRLLRRGEDDFSEHDITPAEAERMEIAIRQARACAFDEHRE